MEIKTTEEIIEWYNKITGFQSCNLQERTRKKKWVAVDDIRQFLKDNIRGIRAEVIQNFEKECQKCE